LLAGGVAIAMGVLTLTSIRDVYIDFVGAEIGQATPEVDNSLRALFDNGGLTENVDVGTYVAIAGGAVALIGGLAAMLVRRRAQVEGESDGAMQPTPETPGDAGAAVPTPETAAPASTEVHDGGVIPPDDVQRSPDTAFTDVPPGSPSDADAPEAPEPPEQPQDRPRGVGDWR
jgi:hypothetical protein